MSDDQGDRGLDTTERLGGGVGPFLGGIASGMVLLAIVWVIMTGANNGGGGGSSGQAGEPAAGGPTTSQAATAGAALDDTAEHVSTPPVPTTLDRCTTASRRLDVPLRDARAALGQWAVHVGAMNQLVVGALTLSQATAFWNQTRMAAYRHIGDFDAAMRALRHRGVDCPAPGLVGSASSPELRACTQHVAAQADQLDAARTAIHTWSRHVKAMDMLRMGKLSPTKATQMWLAMWQRGKHEIDSYTQAARTTNHTPGCDGSVAAPASGSGSHASHESNAQGGGGSGSAPASPSESPMQMN
jgi:hypothetical protein